MLLSHTHPTPHRGSQGSRKSLVLKADTNSTRNRWLRALQREVLQVEVQRVRNATSSHTLPLSYHVQAVDKFQQEARLKKFVLRSASSRNLGSGGAASPLSASPRSLRLGSFRRRGSARSQSTRAAIGAARTPVLSRGRAGYASAVTALSNA